MAVGGGPSCAFLFSPSLGFFFPFFDLSGKATQALSIKQCLLEAARGEEGKQSERA